jgi:hypothetical protein
MAPADETDENEEFSTPHLPERYHQIVRAKKQRRLKKRLLVAGAAILIAIGIFLVLSWAAGGLAISLPAFSPHQPPSSVTNQVQPGETGGVKENTSTTNISFTRGPGLATQLPPGLVPLDQAVGTLQSDYPESAFTLTNADFTVGAGHFLYKFTLRPADNGSGPDLIAYIDAKTGKAYSPEEETAGISRDVAQRQAIATFPDLHPDRVLLTFASNADTGKQWDYASYDGERKVASGSFDADTGKLISFFRYLPPEGRPESPPVDIENARSIADRYIIDHNGGQLPVNMSVVHYQPFSSPSGPVAGQYIFTYERMFQDFLTDTDGFTVIVDAATGEVTGYTQQWTTPEHAFSASAEPEVIKREATFAVMQKAKEMYPDNVGGLRIISAELRWKNRVPYGTVPRPGTIPLGWKVVFDDDIIRANAPATPGVAWVDGQTGNFISFDYRH